MKSQEFEVGAIVRINHPLLGGKPLEAWEVIDVDACHYYVHPIYSDAVTQRIRKDSARAVTS